METNYIFVYGLLKSRYENEPAKFIRSNCNLVGDGYFPGTLIDIGTYPGAVYKTGSESRVFGEVYEIKRNKEELVSFLDHFEGVGSEFKEPNEYIRKVIPIQTKTGEINASCYLYNWDWSGKRIIESGRYENEAGTREG